ncbi:AraC family transcriptional regulator [Shewanella yunxiaonensis]|uniref:AraC family transcriptional regulator n=1 Tax=Shewanella yunxiaonensis TaxID=2829809 RepID=A0ABX7YQW4_9GAMM|nr:AraC family transcriptional regulator [Shewanella yunxiaonensis]QUN05163.1 AraC family transcriptional regulator [Shewanella yunxiaonensis]
MKGVSERHQQSIQRVCEYIQQHLDEELSAEQLSEVAACSRFHFHRIFMAFMGLSTTRYIQRVKLRRASFQLAFEQQKIIDIAIEAGFGSSEAFTRAFKSSFLQTPSQFRTQPDWQHWHSVLQLPMIAKEDYIMDVKIVDFPPRNIAYLSHRGSPQRVLDSAAKFIAWRKQTGLSPVASSETYAVPYSDPNTVAPEDFRLDICGTIQQSQIPYNEFGVIAGTLPGGRCAVARHYGSHDHIGDTVYRLYREWLPQSGEELRDFPCYFHWLNFVHEVDESELMTDVYLPLK